jgi:galactokinase
MLKPKTERIALLSAIWDREFSSENRMHTHMFSAPGRIEILGNHTDHQHGLVLTAAIDLDTLGIAAKSENERITVFSEGFPTGEVELSDLSVLASGANPSSALIRGIADGFAKRGYRIGGFDACISGNVPKGSGLSSSASFEVWVAAAMNGLYNGGRVNPVEIARICH